MATKTIRLDKRGIDRIIKGFERPLTKGKDFFNILGGLIDRDTDRQFDNQGAAGGMRKIPAKFAWPPFSPRTLQSSGGTFRKRPGTDRAIGRRYSFGSKLLVASSLFKKSFKVMRTGRTFLKYGAVHKLRGKIGSNPERQVLIVTPTDRQRYGLIFSKFVDKNLIF